MELGIEGMKSGKREATEGIELPPNVESIRTIREKKKLRVLENTGSRNHQTGRDETKTKKEKITTEERKTS